MSIARHDNARCPARAARTPIHPALPTEIRERAAPPLKLLPVGRGPTHIVVLTADGARGYGMLGRHSARALDALDALLDYRDAANEGPDGLLPHQRPAAMILDLPAPRAARRPRRRAA
jgi:hypothetical protein